MTDRETVVLGALLHDVGKFWQRTGLRKRHQDLSATFLEQLEVRAKLSNVVNVDDLRTVVLDHHEQGSYDILVQIVRIADWLASGERRAREEDQTGTPQTDPLISVFSQIFTEGGELPYRYYSTAPLQLTEEDLFPRASVETDYPGLWNAFVDEFKHLPNGSFAALFESLLFLLQKYLWCVPAATYRHIPDVSLFDHSKVTAAIAWCLYEQKDRIGVFEQQILQEASETDTVALLVGGDLSGIQSFIYTVSSQGASKGLRGRSVFLGLLSEAVAHYVMQRMGDVPLTNLLYNSGGHFYLLVPPSQSGKVEAVQHEIAERLFDPFDGALYCGLEEVPLSVKDFQIRFNTLSIRWGELSSRMSVRKRQRFVGLAREQYERVFEPQGTGNLRNRCVVCHREISQASRLTIEDQKEQGPVCSLCHSFEELGQELRDAQYLTVKRVSPDISPRLPLTWERVLETFGADYQFVRTFGEDIDTGRIYILDDTNVLPEERHGEAAWGFKFIGKTAPVDENGTVRSFEELADLSEGVSQWGLMRMDVDYLGRIFKEGLGQNVSLSRICTLSSMISLFFEGYLNELCKEVAAGQIYLIYSGGDDSFIVGSWDKIIELATEIRSQFDRYVCRNPRITLSTGAVIEGKKYPLYKAADHGKEALDAAKHYRKEKDAVTFLGRTLSWGEFEKVVEAKNLLLSLFGSTNGSQKLSRGFLQKLHEIFVLYRENKERLSSWRLNNADMERLVLNDRWRWRLIYNLSKEKELGKEGEQLQKMIVQEKWIDILDVPIRWVELLSRT